MINFIKHCAVLIAFCTSLLVISPTSIAGLIQYDANVDEWSVTDWYTSGTTGSGEFAPSSFTAYTSTNGVAMLRNDDMAGWWIGDVGITTWSRYYAGDELTVSVVGATWAGIVDYETVQVAGGNFYAAMNNSQEIINATGLAIGDSLNGVFSWSGSIDNMQLNYVANSIPEPTAIALLSIAFISFGFSIRKRA